MLAFVHPGVTVIPFVIQFAIGIIGAFTSINYYLFTERIRVAKILGPYKPKNEGSTTVIIQQQYPQQGYGQPQPTTQYYPPQQQEQYYPPQQQQQEGYPMQQPQTTTAQYYPQGQLEQVVYPQQPITQDVKSENYIVEQQQYQENGVSDQAMVNVDVQQ